MAEIVIRRYPKNETRRLPDQDSYFQQFLPYLQPSIPIGLSNGIPDGDQIENLVDVVTERVGQLPVNIDNLLINFGVTRVTYHQDMYDLGKIEAAGKGYFIVRMKPGQGTYLEKYLKEDD